MTVEHRLSCRVVALALGGVLVLSGGCATLFGSRAETSADHERAGDECRPLEVDDTTTQLWVEALHAFIVRQRVRQGCILVRSDECYRDPPPEVLDGLRDRELRLESWPFLCGEGVTVLTLKDEGESDERTISVGDGFKVTCRWKIRRRWFPWQGRLRAEGCSAATSGLIDPRHRAD